MATVLGDSRQKETLNTLDYTSSSAAYEVALLNSKPITNPDLGYNFQPTYSSNPLYTTPSPNKYVYIVAAGVLITLLFAIKR